MAQTFDNAKPAFGASFSGQQGFDGFDPLGLDELSPNSMGDDLPAPRMDIPTGFEGADFPVPKLGVPVPPLPPSARVVNSAAQVPTIGGSNVSRASNATPPRMPRMEPFGVSGQAQQAYPMPKADAFPSFKAQDAYPSPKGGQDNYPAFRMPGEPEIHRTNTADLRGSGTDFMAGLDPIDDQRQSSRNATVAFDRFISDADMNAAKGMDAVGVPLVHKPTYDRASNALDDVLMQDKPFVSDPHGAVTPVPEPSKIRLGAGLGASVRKEDYDIDNDSGLPLNDDPLGMIGGGLEPNNDPRGGLKLDFPANLEATRMGERHEHSGLLSVGKLKNQEGQVPELGPREKRSPSQVIDELSGGGQGNPAQQKATMTSGLINYSELAKKRNHEAADMLGLLGSIQNGELAANEKGVKPAADSQDGAVTETHDDGNQPTADNAQPTEGGSDDEMTFDLSSIRVEKDSTIVVKQMLAENKAKAQEKKKRNVKRLALIAAAVVIFLVLVSIIVVVIFMAKAPVEEKDLAPMQVIKVVEMSQEQIAKDSLRDYRQFFQTSVQNNNAVDITPEKRLENQGMVILNTVFASARFQRELEDQLAMVESSVATLEEKDTCKGGWCALGLWSWAVYKNDDVHAEKYDKLLAGNTEIAQLSNIQNIVRAIVERNKFEGKSASYEERVASQKRVRELLEKVSGWPLADYMYAEACVKMGEMDEAPKRLEAYADKIDDVSYAGLTMLQAEIDYLRGEYDHANTLAQKVIDLSTGETQQIIRANTLALRTKAVLSEWSVFAKEVLDEKLKTYANQPVLLATVADICIQKGHADQCRILYQALIDGDPDNTDVRQQHARLYVYAIGIRNLYLSNDLYKNEINDLSKMIDIAIKMNTGDILLWIYRALAEYAQKNYKTSLEAAIEAERDVNYDWVHNYAPLIQKKIDGDENPILTLDFTEVAKNAYYAEDNYIVGEILNSQRKYKASLEQMKRALRIYPQDARLWEVALNAAIELKDKAMVDASIEALRVQRAMTSYHQYCVARFINDTGDPDEALKRMSVIISQEPTNPEFLFYIGQLYFNRGNYDSASQYFEKTIEYDSSNPESYYYAGRCYYELKRYNNALSSFSEARNKAETNPTYALWIGLAQKSLDMNEEALRSFTVVIDTRAPMGKIPTNMSASEQEELAQAYQQRGMLNSARQRRKEAQSDFDLAAKLAPENMQFVREYVVFLYETGNSKAVLDRIKVLEQKHEMDAIRYYVVGLTYLQVGQREQALKALETARDKGFADLEQTGIAGLRDSAEIYERIGYMYRDVGRKKEAVAMLTKYLEKARYLSDSARREIQHELSSL